MLVPNFLIKDYHALRSLSQGVDLQLDTVDLNEGLVEVLDLFSTLANKGTLESKELSYLSGHLVSYT